METIDKILVVDDDTSMIKLYKRIIPSLGYAKLDNILIAENGKIALDMVKKEKNNIKLIITDTNMPEMNGYELIENARKIGYTNFIIQATGNPENEIARYANSMLAKPFSLDELDAELGKYIKKPVLA